MTEAEQIQTLGVKLAEIKNRLEARDNELREIARRQGRRNAGSVLAETTEGYASDMLDQALDAIDEAINALEEG